MQAEIIERSDPGRRADAEVLELQLSRSARLTAAMVVAHLVAAAALWVSLPFGFSLAGSALLLASCTQCLRLHGLRSPARAIARLRLRADGEVEAMRRDGQCVNGTIVASSFMSPGLIVLRIRRGRLHPPLSVVIPADAIGDESHRRLRVWLKWRRFALRASHAAGDGGPRDPVGDGQGYDAPPASLPQSR